MRVGFNPKKDTISRKSDYFHQVIIPVYIPNELGYFKDSFTILKYCLESLFKTSHSKTYFTVVNNGSCDKIVQYLQTLFLENKINEIIHTSNIGYVNAMLKGIVGHNFPIVTTSDADVLFLNDWQVESYALMNVFPRLGAICLTPTSKSLKFYNYKLIFDNFFLKKFNFIKVANPSAMQAFAKSINNHSFFNKHHLNKILVVEKNGTYGVAGAGHYVVTYKGLIFSKLSTKYTDFSLGGGSDAILDKPVAEQGFWRMSTYNNFAYHMGNVYEQWIEEKFSLIQLEKNEVVIPDNLNYQPSTIFVPLSKIFFKILNKKYFWKVFLKFKGLTKEESTTY